MMWSRMTNDEPNEPSKIFAHTGIWPFKQFSAKGSYLKENTTVSAESNLYRTQ